MLAWPPWISTSSGYFCFGSNAGGRATKSCRRRPRAFVNQNSWSGCQSSRAACSELACERGRVRFAAVSTRTISFGSVALPQLATTTAGRALPATSIAAKAPRVSSAGLTAPPAAETE